MYSYPILKMEKSLERNLDNLIIVVEKLEKEKNKTFPVIKNKIKSVIGNEKQLYTSKYSSFKKLEEEIKDILLEEYLPERRINRFM